MSIVSRLLLAMFLLGLSGCTHSGLAQVPITVDKSTTKLSGWFESKGEWTLFSKTNNKNYDPYTKVESLKCVSLINATGKQRSFWNRLNGKRVDVVGYVTSYDQLDDGQTGADRLLAKKYYGDQVVHNFCLRDYVFVVEDMISDSVR